MIRLTTKDPVAWYEEGTTFVADMGVLLLFFVILLASLSDEDS